MHLRPSSVWTCGLFIFTFLCIPISLSGCRDNATDLCHEELQALLESALAEVGIPDAWTGIEMSTDLHTRAGSLTKSFAAALILRLWEEELLGLDDVIDEYYPGLVPYSDVITIRDLLNMTAGLLDYTHVSEWEDAWPNDTYTPESLVRAAVDGGGNSFPPGEGWQYSNTNYVVLGMIAEKVGGASYASLVRSYLIESLGLTQTYVPEVGDSFIPEPTLHGYTWAFSDDGVWQDYTWLDPDWVYSAGNIVSTLDDLYLWMQALLEGTFLSPKVQAIMWEMVEAGGGLYYGAGVLQISQTGLEIRGHNGGMPAYETSAYRYNDVYIVVMTNGNIHPDNEIQIHAGDYIGGALAMKIYDQK